MAQTICRSIGSSSDDVEEYGAGIMYFNSSDLELVEDNSRGIQHIGLRFNNINIPQGATITSAFIQFTTDEATSSSTHLDIRIQDIDHAPAFSTADYDLSSRMSTTSSVSWSPASWPTVGESNITQRSPDIGILTQEIISRPGFQSGNSLVFIITGTGQRIAESYDGDASTAPELCITYQPDFTSDLHLNEVMSSNNATIADNHGEFDDWIEIYNPSPTSRNLAGFYLSDDPLDPLKYQIPDSDPLLTTAPPYGYLLLWADNAPDQGANHLDFKLSAGETATLTSDDGSTLLSSVPIPEALGGDESFGSIQDGGNGYQSYTTSTPNASNETSSDTEIGFSRESGFFTSAFSLSMSALNPNGVVRYTLDGSDPNSSSSTYSSPLNITSDTQVNARFFNYNGTISHLQTRVYLTMSTDINSFSSDLPLILIDTYSQSLDQTTMKNTLWSVIEPTNNGRSYLTDSPSFSGKAAMKIRGASSFWFQKKQWRIELRQEDDSDLDVSLLGLPADSDWVLYGPGRYDRGLINNALMFELSRRLGKYAPRTRFVELFFCTDGEMSSDDYHGIYVLTEKIKVHDDRVSIAKITPNDNSGEDLTGGYLLSIDRTPELLTPYTVNYYASNHPGWNMGYTLSKPDAEEITTQQENYLSSSLIEMEDALTSPTWLDPNSGYRSKMNIDSWTHAHLLKALTKEPDGFMLSFYLQKDKNDSWNAGPIWDFDRAINSTDLRSQDYDGWDTGQPNSPNTGNVHYWTGGNGRGLYIKEMVNDPLYRTNCYDKWYDWRKNEVLETSVLNSIIDSLAAILDESHTRNFARWTGSDYNPRYGGFYGEIEAMKTWFQQRSEWIDGQFIRPPLINPSEGTVSLGQTVTLINPNGSGTIYYTHDGTDPMDDSGGISSTAMTYSSPLPITWKGATYVQARVRVGTEWGGMCQAKLVVPETYDHISINEIHYKPQDELSGIDTIPGNNFEFIELINSGSSDVSLSGITLSEGVSYEQEAPLVIPAGGFVIYAENALHFEQRYGFSPHGQYTGELKNSGEEIVLLAPDGVAIDVVEYDDQVPWPELADNGIYSLALSSSSLDNSLAESWAIQCQALTTPGAQNDLSCPESSLNGLIINEVHYNPLTGSETEFIELVNTTNEAIQLQGCAFTEGIEFSFDFPFSLAPSSSYPNNYLVLASNFSAFQNEYGQIPYGEYQGQLNNSGELILLTDDQGFIIDQLSYLDHSPWHPLADAGTHSLALFSENIDNSNPENWGIQEELTTPGWRNFQSQNHCPPDFTGDGEINVSDFLELNSHFGSPCDACPYDLTGDGLVNVSDFLEFNTAYGMTCPIYVSGPDVLSSLHPDLEQDLIHLHEEKLHKELSEAIELMKESYDVIIYPNPNDGYAISIITLDFGLHMGHTQEIIIRDQTGRIAYQSLTEVVTSASSIHHIKLDKKLSSGLYFLQVNAPNSHAVKKFIVQ